ncbi:EF hand family protein [Cryptosporidium serpentis]
MVINKRTLFFFLITCIFSLFTCIQSVDVENIKNEFKEFDLNGDQLIDAQEIRTMRVSVTLQELQGFFWEVDVDSSGAVTFQEYMDFAINNLSYSSQ